MQVQHTKVAAIFHQIAATYDFSCFSLDDFAQWLAIRRGRPIEFIPFPPNLTVQKISGFWVIINNTDVIVYSSNTLPIHQLHIQLHELSHILCNHTTVEFHDWEQFFLSYKNIRARRVYGEHLPEQEKEAEGLAELILYEIQRHRRREHLAAIASTSPQLAHYWHSMEA